jgi:hypothetical protein
MKKARRAAGNGDMLADYDFRGGVRGKYAQRYAEGCNVVVLAPEVAQVFRDSRSVNDALRPLADLIRKQARKKRAPSRA